MIVEAQNDEQALTGLLIGLTSNGIVTMTLQQILDNASSSARQDQHDQQEFRDWILTEQAKVNDPKARSYSVFAQLVNISK